MTTTTSYGTWANHGGDDCVTVEDSVVAALGEFADDYDVDAITAAYRDSINIALPHGVTLNGDDFYGPYYEADQDFDGYPMTEEGALDITEIVADAPFWRIVEQHEK